MADAKYKLTSFYSKGRAEGIRYMFAYVGVEFEDERIKKEDWPAIKAKNPRAALPILEVYGRKLPQSACIYRYLGKQFGLTVLDPWIDANLEVVVDDVKDLVNKLSPYFLNIKDKTPEAMKEIQNSLKLFLDHMESLTQQGYFYGNKPTWVDFFFVGHMDAVADLYQNVLANHPKLQALSDRIKSNVKVQKYIKHRPTHEMNTSAVKMTETKYKLTYFNTKGLAEGIRYMFSYANVPFEDVRIKNADWPALKNKQPDGTLPVLEVDGTIISQSACIARFLGKKFGFVPQDPLLETHLEVIIDNIKETMNKMKEYKDKDTPEAIADSKEVIKNLMDKLEPLSDKGYFYGDKPSWVDFYFTGLTEALGDLNGNVLINHPKLQSITDKIRNDNNVQKYIKQRPEPEKMT